MLVWSGFRELPPQERDLPGATIAFLPKPFSLKQLVEKVKEVMGE